MRDNTPRFDNHNALRKPSHFTLAVTDEECRDLKLMDNAFEDSAYGLTPDLVRHFNKEYYFDPDAIAEIQQDANFTIHDTIGGAQSFALTMVMNGTRLRRLYDNEFRTAGTDNPVTMVEVVRTVTDNVWREYAQSGTQVSSLRRNLQREHLERLVTLALLKDAGSASLRAVSTLARAELKRVDALAESGLKGTSDAYTKAHLDDARTRIAKTLDAAYVVNR